MFDERSQNNENLMSQDSGKLKEFDQSSQEHRKYGQESQAGFMTSDMIQYFLSVRSF